MRECSDSNPAFKGWVPSENWQQREQVPGIAIDEAITRYPEDSIWLERQADGGYLVRVNVIERAVYPTKHIALEACEKGGFLPVLSVLASVNTKGALDHFSLTQAQSLPYRVDSAALVREVDTGSQSANQVLWDALGFILETTRLRPKRPDDFAEGRYPASTIVDHFTAFACRVAAEFALTNNIPALYYDVPAHHGQKGYYTLEPSGHVPYGHKAYLPFTSPLWREVDRNNQANISAHLQGRQLPFAKNRLQKRARRSNASSSPRIAKGEQGLLPIRPPRSRQRRKVGNLAIMAREDTLPESSK